MVQRRASTGAPWSPAMAQWPGQQWWRWWDDAL